MPDPRPLALVTGASSGIGLALARHLADGGFDLVLNAEDSGVVAAAEQVRSTGTAVEPVQADLRSPDGVEQLYVAVRGRPLDAAVLNAGSALGEAFVDQDLDAALSVVDLNVRSTVHLAHLVLRDMVGRGRGRVLLTSSIVATTPGPYQAVYNASKAFVQSFAEALQDEVRDSPVTVTSLLPGPTHTSLFARAGLLGTRLGRSSAKDDPADVARRGYEALMRGERRVIGSPRARAMELAARVAPDRVTVAVHRLMTRPGG